MAKKISEDTEVKLDLITTCRKHGVVIFRKCTYSHCYWNYLLSPLKLYPIWDIFQFTLYTNLIEYIKIVLHKSFVKS